MAKQNCDWNDKSQFFVGIKLIYLSHSSANWIFFPFSNKLYINVKNGIAVYFNIQCITMFIMHRNPLKIGLVDYQETIQLQWPLWFKLSSWLVLIDSIKQANQLQRTIEMIIYLLHEAHKMHTKRLYMYQRENGM